MSQSNLTWQQSGMRWLWLAILVFVADIAIKFLVLHTIPMGWQHRIEVLPFFNLLYVQNHGAAFSFLSDEGGWQRWLFTAIAIGVSAFLLFSMRRQPAKPALNNVSYALIVGGAIGNVFDRIVHGFVIDYLDFFWGNSHWPAFNLADSAICIGAALIILDGFRSQPEGK
ncbi:MULTISPECIES: signal peptidase II [unclassified Vibrio]|uniref:Lipoprotein signal peptidase n=1 Tax=Vibrio sp. HB236076 TaxID=3232307 RepID=A0AB39HHK8_9VIBR|nr:signal peptidase II [Vibrio sp. HB161653]MDP5254609.1 signal peptidase II [Vibrio sp. HB161653]